MTIEIHQPTYELKDGTGSAAQFTFAFPLYDATNETDDVFVYVWNTSTLVWDQKTLGTHYTISGTTVTFTSGNIPASGSKNIIISRTTDIKFPKADYVAGSAVKAEDLDNNQTQALYAIQELRDSKVSNRNAKILGNLDMDSNKIINVATPTAATDATNKSYVDTAVSIAATVGATAPTNPSNGDRWYDTVSGRTFVYYSDADSSQWVDSAPPLDSGVGGSGGSGDQQVFKTFKVTSGGSSVDVIADGTTDTFELVAGNNVTLTPDATNDKVTINSSATTTIGDGAKGEITVSNSGATWTINNDAVTYAKMQDTTTANRVIGAVSAGELTEVQVNEGMIANDAVSDTKLQDSTTTDNDRAVGTNHIKDNAVTNVKIADDTIAESKLDIHNAPSGTDKYLKYTSNGMEWATVSAGGGSGDIEGVTAGTGLSGGGTSGTVTVNADVGTTANKLVQLDGNARLPTVDGRNLTNINANQLYDGTIPDGRFPATLPAVSGANLTNITATGPGLTGWVSVKDSPHSATGDGSTDDTSAIQSAIDSLGTGGGTVWFPPGVYKLGSPLVLSNNNSDDYVTLQGAGPANYGNDNDISAGGGATLKRTSNGNFINITNTRGTQIRNLLFKGSNMSSGIAINTVANAGSTQHLYENLVFNGIANCIHLGGLSQSIINNILVRHPNDSSDTHAIKLYKGSYDQIDQIRIENVIIDGSPTASDGDKSENMYGISLYGKVNTVFVRDTSVLRCKRGIRLHVDDDEWDGEFIYFVNVEVERCDGNGFSFDGDGNFIFMTNCYSCLNSGNGLAVQNNYRGTLNIEGFNSRANGHNGIYFYTDKNHDEYGQVSISNTLCMDNSNSNHGGDGQAAGIRVARSKYSHMSIIGGKCGGGTNGLDSGSQKYGIDFHGSDHKYITIVGVNCKGNSSSSINNSPNSDNAGSIYFQNTGTNNSSSSMNFIANCPGFNSGQTSFP